MPAAAAVAPRKHTGPCTTLHTLTLTLFLRAPTMTLPTRQCAPHFDRAGAWGPGVLATHVAKHTALQWYNSQHDSRLHSSQTQRMASSRRMAHAPSRVVRQTLISIGRLSCIWDPYRYNNTTRQRHAIAVVWACRTVSLSSARGGGGCCPQPRRHACEGVSSATCCW